MKNTAGSFHIGNNGLTRSGNFMTITSLSRRLHIPPSTDPWGRTLRRAGIVYLLSRLFVIMGAAIAVAAQAVVDRSNDVEPTNGLSGLADILASWDGHWYLDVVREGYPHHIMPNVTYFVSDARAAFFPMYPRFVHYIDVVVPGGPVSMALAVNIILGACFVFLAGYLCRGLFDIKTAEKAMILIARGPNKGSRFLITADGVSIGRSSQSSIFLDDITVSRTHATIVKKDKSFVLKDSGSLNGTYINNISVNEHTLVSGDEFQIGKFHLLFIGSNK